jgi:hypothetical protein
MQKFIAGCLIGALELFSGCAEHYTPKVDLSESLPRYRLLSNFIDSKRLLKPRCPVKPMDWWHLTQKWLSREN